MKNIRQFCGTAIMLMLLSLQAHAEFGDLQCQGFLKIEEKTILEEKDLVKCRIMKSKGESACSTSSIPGTSLSTSFEEFVELDASGLPHNSLRVNLIDSNRNVVNSGIIKARMINSSIGRVASYLVGDQLFFTDSSSKNKIVLRCGSEIF